MITQNRLAKYNAAMERGERMLNNPVNLFRKAASEIISNLNLQAWNALQYRNKPDRDVEIEMLVEKHFPAPVSWTKVTDAKPRPTRVLVYFPSQSTSVMDALYTHEGNFIVDGIDRTEAVTHWSYMPADPVD